MKQKFRFIFRFDGELGQVIRACRPGDAERYARQLARAIAEKYTAADVVCVWHGPAESKLPKKLLAEASA